MFRRFASLTVCSLMLAVFPSELFAKSAVVSPLVGKTGVDPLVVLNITSLVSSEIDFSGTFDNVKQLETMPSGMNFNCLALQACLSTVTRSAGADVLFAGSLAKIGQEFDLALIYYDLGTNSVIRKKNWRVAADPTTLADRMTALVKELLTGQSAAQAKQQASLGDFGAMKGTDVLDEDGFNFDTDTSPKRQIAVPQGKGQALEDADDDDAVDAAAMREEETRSQAAQKRAQEESRKKAEQDRVAREAEAKKKAEQDRIAAAAEAKRMAEQERLAAAAEAKRKAEQDRLAAAAEAKRKAEQDRLAREAEVKRKAEEDKRAREAAAAQLAAGRSVSSASSTKSSTKSGSKAASKPAPEDDDIVFASVDPSDMEDINFAPVDPSEMEATPVVDSQEDEPLPGRYGYAAAAGSTASKASSSSSKSSTSSSKSSTSSSKSSTSSSKPSSGYSLEPASDSSFEDDDFAPPSSTRKTSLDIDDFEEDEEPVRKPASKQMDLDEDSPVKKSRPKETERSSSRSSLDAEVSGPRIIREKERFSQRQTTNVSARLGTSGYHELQFLTYGAEVAFPVSTSVRIGVGVDGYSVRRTVPVNSTACPSALVVGVSRSCWNTILPFHVGSTWQPGESTFRPFVGADLLVTPYHKDLSGALVLSDLAWGARLRPGIDIMTSRNFGFTLDAGLGFLSGKSFSDAGVENSGLNWSLSAGTVLSL